MIFNKNYMEETDWSLIIECSGTDYFIAEEAYGGQTKDGVILDRDLDKRINIIRIYFPEDDTAKHKNSDRVKVSFDGRKRKNDPFIILHSNGEMSKFSNDCKDQLKDINSKHIKLVEEFVNYACEELHDYCRQYREHPENINMDKLDEKYEEFLKLKGNKRSEHNREKLLKLRGKY